MSEHTTVAPSSEQEQVEYRDVPGFPGYRVGSNGTVWSKRKQFMIRGEGGRIVGAREGMVDSWHQLKLTVNRFGKSKIPYQTVCLRNCQAGVRRAVPVHRLVLEVFVGMRPAGLVCCHGNGNSLDNRLENLRWDTSRSNGQDAVKHGTTRRGEAHRCARLTVDQVREIRRLSQCGKSNRFLAELYSMSISGIKGIVYFRTWRHVK
jgi:hypothetical protein